LRPDAEHHQQQAESDRRRPRGAEIGSTGPMMMSIAPASAVTAVAMPNAHCLMRTGSAPIRRSAPSSCATALIARPVKVFFRYSVSPAVSASAIPNATSMRSGTRISPIFRLWPM
jgi:hypothetical protein